MLPRLPSTLAEPTRPLPGCGLQFKCSTFNVQRSGLFKRSSRPHLDFVRWSTVSVVSAIALSLWSSFTVSPPFSRVACPHPCTRPCRPRSYPRRRHRSHPRSPASSPSTSCCHVYHSHLGCCLCAVAVVVMALPSSSPCRIRIHCRCLCCHLHHRRVVARHYPRSCHYPHPLCSRPHHRHHRPHCPSPLPLLSVRLTVALASHFMQIPAPRIMLALAPGLMRVLIACF